MNIRPQGVGGLDVSHRAPLWPQEATVGLKDGQVFGRQVVGGVALADLRPGQDLMGQIVFDARLKRPVKDVAVGRAAVERTGAVE